MLSECQVDENQLTNAAKMPACTERATTRYVTNWLKGGPSHELCAFLCTCIFYSKMCPSHAIIIG